MCALLSSSSALLGDLPDHGAVLGWLQEMDERRLERLWNQADAVRKAHVGPEVHLRGLIEAGNHCIRNCLYCGICSGSHGLERYRMTGEEILACAWEAQTLGYGSVVIQAGEDPGLTRELVTDVVRGIKASTLLAVTLSLGEREDGDLAAWRKAGADRYLLRFETSDPELYRRIHPGRNGLSDRLGQLVRMREMGYEIGTGVMVGVPGQTWDILAQDLLQFSALDVDMIGVGPFLPSPRTVLGGPRAIEFAAPNGQQVPNDELTTLKVVALARLLCPDANIPSTTALATLDPKVGRELGLSRGANVVMPNVTPERYRMLYELYPGKACLHETAQACRACLESRIRAMGRIPGQGPGGRRRRL